jgi:hypothetical protein
MPKAKEPRPKFQKYVAGHDGSPGIVIGRSMDYRRDRGLRVFPFVQVVDGEASGPRLDFAHRIPLYEILAQADTFLGIVVKVERLIKLQKLEAPTT